MHPIHLWIPLFRLIFDMAQAEGIHMNKLDIGGGFPGADNDFFEEIATVINQKIDEHFPKMLKLLLNQADLWLHHVKQL